MGKLNLFIDTNVIIDLLADRKPFSNGAYEVFSLVNNVRWKLYTSSNSILTSYYIVEKLSNSKSAKKAIKTILGRIHIQDVTQKELENALVSKIGDYEDATQIQCAMRIGKIDFIITRDKKGFKDSQFKILSPAELVSTT